jgi:integrase
VIGTPKTADEAVVVRLKKNEKFKKWQSKADTVTPASAGDLRRQVNDICRIAGVVMINDSLVGTHALRRGTAFDLNHVPAHLWKAGANASISALLGHSSANTAKGLAIRYADAATEDAPRARESVLPALESDDDDDGTA